MRNALDLEIEGVSRSTEGDLSDGPPSVNNPLEIWKVNRRPLLVTSASIDNY
jgi:hypothetical protein